MAKYLFALTCVVLISGCPAGDGDGAGVDATDGADMMDGDMMDGDAMDGDAMDGDAMDGDAMDGDMMNGGAEATRFRATLSGDNEVPPVQSSASGTATVSVTEDGTGLDYTVTVMNAQGIMQAHIHIGGPDENGPVVAFLFGLVEPVDVDGELASGTLSAEDLVNDLVGLSIDDLLDEIRAGNAYVNVHSDANPGGEIRGQLEPDDS